MSTTPTPITTIERDITWIRSHAIIALLTVALIAGSIIGGVSIFETLIEHHDARVAASQLAKEGVDTASQQALLTQLQQMQTANAARDAQQAALIQTLVQQMAQQRAQTAKQIKTDATLDAQAAAARLVVQTKMSPADVTVVNNSVTMDLPLTRIVVADLDQLPQAQADVNNLQSQLDAQKILTSDAKVEASDAQKVIDADKTELIATIKADNAACVVSTNEAVQKQVTKDGKRSKWLILLGALVGGFIGHSI
jgi:hypothetical protein